MDTQTGQAVSRLDGHNDLVMAAQFTADARRIVTASWDNTVRLWDTESGTPIAVGREHTADVETVAIAPDMTTIASAGADGTIRLWRAKTLEPLATLHGHHGRVLSVAFSEDGSRIVSSGIDGHARIWDAARLYERSVLRGHTSYVYPVAVRPDGTQIASGGWDSAIRLWNAASLEPEGVLTAHTGAIYQLRYTPDGKRIVSVTDDDTVRVWNADTRAEIARRHVPEAMWHPTAFAPDASRLVFAWNRAQSPRVWDPETDVMSEAPLSSLAGASGRQFSPDRRFAIVLDGDRRHAVALRDGSTVMPLHLPPQTTRGAIRPPYSARTAACLPQSRPNTTSISMKFRHGGRLGR